MFAYRCVVVVRKPLPDRHLPGLLAAGAAAAAGAADRSRGALLALLLLDPRLCRCFELRHALGCVRAHADALGASACQVLDEAGLGLVLEL